jgi:hypothetical protein
MRDGGVRVGVCASGRERSRLETRRDRSISRSALGADENKHPVARTVSRARPRTPRRRRARARSRDDARHGRGRAGGGAVVTAGGATLAEKRERIIAMYH